MPHSQLTLKAPSHLSAASRRWWEDVVTRWQLDLHHIKILTCAAESWDEMEEARRQIKAQGLTVPTAGGGSKPNPLVAIRRHARTSFLRSLRELDLDTEPAPDAKRPPALRSLAR